MKQNNCENIFQIEAKIDPKWRVWGITLGGRGGHFGRILEAWVASGCQMSLGRRFGRIFSNFLNFLKKNLAIFTKNWLHLEGQDDLKLKAKTVKNSMRQSFVLLMTSKIDFGWIFCRFWQGKWSQVGIKMKFNIDRTSKSDVMKNLHSSQRENDDF